MFGTEYFYDGLERTGYADREGFSGKVCTDYDAAYRRLTETVSAGGLTRESVSVYDTAGRLKSTTAPSGLVTEYGYENGGRRTVVTRPGNVTGITERHIGGRTESVSGTGVIPRHHEYGVNDDGTQWTKNHTGSTDSSSPAWEKTTTDMLGRTVRTDRSAFGGGTQTAWSEYNAKGQIIRTSAPEQADTLYEYDELGRQFRSGADISHSDALENASEDRISESETLYTYFDEAWWQETGRYVYAKENDGTATLTGVVRVRLTGLGASSARGLMTQETVSADIHGNETVTRTFLDRANRMETRVTDYPDSLFDSESVSVKGFLTSSAGKSGVTFTYGYDALGRRTGVTDPRTGTTVTHYNEKGQVGHVENPAGNRTTYHYDENTGRKTARENALGKKTRYAYSDRGQVTHTWGDVPYPVMYVYDSHGRPGEMRTFRGGTGWNSETWPGGTADVTRWHYDEATGLLLAKEDAAGKQVTYTHTPAGKLRTRTWARKQGGQNIVTTYSYDPDTGEQTGTDYSDSGTSDITFTYDRLGRRKTVTDAAGTRTFVYDDNTLQLISESITGLYNKTITRTYETVGVKGRSTGFYTGGGEYGVTYGYEGDTGRFSSVVSNVNGVSGTATYSYIPDSDLLYQVTSGSGPKTTYAYEPKRNLRTQVRNGHGTSLISQYDYKYDEIGRRGSVRNSGDAFTTAAFNLYGYNDRSELRESHRYQGTDIENPGIPADPETRLYAYDPIGNRKSATEGTTDIGYTADSLNQYTALTDGITANPVYDEDGNMLSDAYRIYTWNAENRLIVAEPENPADGDKKAEYLYDYMGRRVRKKVFSYTAGTWGPESEKLLVYDGWNLIEEITVSGGETAEKYYVWGLDLSQSLQGAGGIGGLICSVDNAGAVHYYLYDANGNVGQLVAEDGSVAARYEYDPFGNKILAEGDVADENPFRFSTKYFDAETGLYYYGFRYYSPELGRWTGRDPIDSRRRWIKSLLSGWE